MQYNLQFLTLSPDQKNSKVTENSKQFEKNIYNNPCVESKTQFTLFQSPWFYGFCSVPFFLTLKENIPSTGFDVCEIKFRDEQKAYKSMTLSTIAALVKTFVC